MTATTGAVPGSTNRRAADITDLRPPPRWARPALIALLLATALLYLRDLTVSGWGNEYYAAAAQAGSLNWQALLFGSHDAANAITVDKPPAALWLMGLSARLFGFGPWSVLAPQALLGVGAVWLLSATVRRWAGPGAGLLAGAVLAATPVAALMFRYDNPDALLTFLLVLAAYCTVRAVDADSRRWWSAGTGWLVAAAVALGLGFLTKMLQALLVLPALAAVFLVAGAATARVRIASLCTAGAALIVSGGWYVLLVELWPEDARPYIGGSTGNSLWELALGYNGLGRLLGGRGNPGSAGEAPSAGAQLGPAFGGDTGFTRLFRDLMATEVSWLLPAALIAFAALTVLSWRAPRTDRTRAAVILWGGWLLVTALVFSFMSGVVHPYYTVALAPAVAALTGTGVSALWRRRTDPAARALLAGLSAITGIWAFLLLRGSSDWLPWLGPLILTASLVAAAGLARPVTGSAFLTRAAATLAILAALAGTGAYALVTTTRPHSGGIPVSGPLGDAAALAPPRVGDGDPEAEPSGSGPLAQRRSAVPPVTPPGGSATDEAPRIPLIPYAPGAPGAPGVQDSSGADGADSAEAGHPGDTGTGHDVNRDGRRPAPARPTAGAPGDHPGPGGPPGPGQPRVTVTDELADLVRGSDRRWAAATVGSFLASALELRTGSPVMAIGGFNGRDSAPTLEEFRDRVAAGEIGWFLAAGGHRPGGGASESAGEQIAAWVARHYAGRRIGEVTVYDLGSSGR